MIFAVRSDSGQRVSHIRCRTHADTPPLNMTEESGAECAMCLGDAIADALTERHERIVTLYRGMFERAVERLNLLSPGAGDQLRQNVMDDLRAIKAEQDAAEAQADADASGGKAM